MYLRKFALIMSVCALVPFATFARAQQFDIAVGGSTLFSTKNSTASRAFVPPPEKGGVYPNFSIDRIYKNRLGYSAELAFRYKQGIYNGYQPYRPLLYDFNAVYAPRLKGVFPSRLDKRISVLLLGGAGGQSVIFYNQFGNCVYSACNTHLNSNHFLVHAGFGIRYRVWRNFFARPEANYYRIFNNDFHSDNVVRLGASVGYTFHTD